MASGYVQRRRTPQPSGFKGALDGLGGMLPSAGKARGKATPSSKKGKAGRFALLTAAAGFAFSNRDKLTQMIKQRGSKDSSPEAVTPTTPVQPTTNDATAPPATPPPATTA
jgi:hypothetical protein